MIARSSRRPAYPSDVTDRQWWEIEPIIPLERHGGRHRSTDMREIVNAINYRWATGCVWRMLPHDFPPWGTVYTYFRRWRCDGTLVQIRAVLLRGAGRGRASRGRELINAKAGESRSQNSESRRKTAPALRLLNSGF